MKELIEFVKLSKYAGERFDLVQAGGGNLSIKLENGDMYIKASGFSLSEAEIDKGHVIVNNLEVLKILENKEVLSELRNRNVCKAEMLMNNITHNISNKPSIETFLHSLLYKYTLHTHPIAVNIIACKVGWREILAGIFPDALLINYETPGILLAVELKKSIIEYEKTYGKKPNIIMLQNHGLIVSSDSQDDIIEMMESVLLKIENYLCINFEQYKLTNKLSSLINSIDDSNYITYLSEDSQINNYLLNKKDSYYLPPLFPDDFVYCGFGVLNLKSIHDINSIIQYKDKYYSLPKVLIYNNLVFLVAQNIKKVKEIEDVLKSRMIVLNTGSPEWTFLSNDEIKFLGNWDSEKYRQKL